MAARVLLVVLSIFLVGCSQMSEMAFKLKVTAAPSSQLYVQQEGFQPTVRTLEVVVDVAPPVLGWDDSTASIHSALRNEYDTITDVVLEQLVAQAKQLGYEPSFRLQAERVSLFHRSPSISPLAVVSSVGKKVTERRKQLEPHNLLYVCLPVAKSQTIPAAFGGRQATLTFSRPVLYLGSAREDCGGMFGLTNKNIGFSDDNGKGVWSAQVRARSTLAIAPDGFDSLYSRVTKNSNESSFQVPSVQYLTTKEWGAVLAKDLADTFASASKPE